MSMFATLSVATAAPQGMRLRPRLAMLALVALVYGVLGRLGISFAIEPGYASPIFPAAGFAVAAMLSLIHI